MVAYMTVAALRTALRTSGWDKGPGRRSIKSWIVRGRRYLVGSALRDSTRKKRLCAYTWEAEDDRARAGGGWMALALEDDGLRDVIARRGRELPCRVVRGRYTSSLSGFQTFSFW